MGRQINAKQHSRGISNKIVRLPPNSGKHDYVFFYCGLSTAGCLSVRVTNLVVADEFAGGQLKLTVGSQMHLLLLRCLLAVALSLPCPA